MPGSARSLRGFLVRAVGIEPTLLAEPDFESGASTNSTTPAAAPSLDQATRDRKTLDHAISQSLRRGVRRSRDHADHRPNGSRRLRYGQLRGA